MSLRIRIKAAFRGQIWSAGEILNMMFVDIDPHKVFEIIADAPDDNELAAALSDREKMSGHYIECRWALGWELIFAEYC